MFRRMLICTLMLIAAATHQPRRDVPARPAPPTNPRFERLKKLAGTWVEADKDGKPTDKVVSVVKVTAGGGRPRDAVPRPAAGDGVGVPPATAPTW